MKHVGKNQRRRKTQALISLLIYHLAKGTFQLEAFTDKLVQLTEGSVIANPINPAAMSEAKVKIDLSKVMGKKRAEKKFVQFIKISQEQIKNKEQLDDSPSLTPRDIINGWADLTEQDKDQFILRVEPRLHRLLFNEHYQMTGQVGLTDEWTFAHPEDAFRVMKNFYSILVRQTPTANMQHLMQKLTTALRNADINSSLNTGRNLLHNASKALISEAVSTINVAFSINPTAKERIIHPLFGTIVGMEADRYGWESGVPNDNADKLNFILKEKGINPNKRILSHSIKDLGRKNIFENLDYALDDSLVKRLDTAIQNRMEKGQVKTTWVFTPTANQEETEKSIREWLFRRDNNGASRTH